MPKGILKLLSGHKETVKAVKFLPGKDGDDEWSYLLSGSDDHSLKLWKLSTKTGDVSCTQTVQDHTAPINCIATLKLGQNDGSGSTIFASGAADATIKIWSFDGAEIKVIQTLKTSPKYFPLALALSPVGDDGNAYILAAAGTKPTVQIFMAQTGRGSIDFSLQATLSGHEGWIRSLDFSYENSNSGSDLLLASASQDKYIRLWRVHQGAELPDQAAKASDPTVGAFLPGKSPSNKAHRMKADVADYSITFESLLFNHDDWIYSAKWHLNSTSGKLQLLSASADNSLAIWEAESTTGIWITNARLGEISREKGATTATGSIGGFWTGLWSPSGTSIITLGRTGSWRRWDLNESQDQWIQGIAVTGHVKSVTGISWSKNGDYLLSTSSDQTTRLHAKWQEKGTWQEMARPQIHGYDLNCIDSLGASQFVSGADEKLMRVFNEPKAVANMLHKLAGIGTESDVQDMPDAANMPVLGLSNKAIDALDDDQEAAPAANPETDRDAIDPATVVRKSVLEIDHPPFEESLSRHTLWPEIEKLYGHGYEISCLAASHDGRLVASACKASSLNHAVIRIFETERWTELRPPLMAHTLTATRLRFSADDEYLLSVGRDRQWAVFEKDSEGANYKSLQANPKGHTRMILDGAWAPTVPGQQQRVFATAGRDKQVKVWVRKIDDAPFELATTVADEQPVTAVDFLPRINKEQKLVLVIGNEAGRIRICTLSGSDTTVISCFAVHPE